MIDTRIKYLAGRVRANVIDWIKYGNNLDIDPKTLLGSCAIASYALWKVLKANGYKADFICATDDDAYAGHCWVKYKDFIIDITSTQFNSRNPAVLIRKANEYKYLEYFPCTYKNDEGLEIVYHWRGQSPIMYDSAIETLVMSLTPN